MTAGADKDDRGRIYYHLQGIYFLHTVPVADISTSTVKMSQRESGLHGQITAKKPLLKDTNNKKRLAWAKKHKQWTLDIRSAEICPNLRFLVPTTVSL